MNAGVFLTLVAPGCPSTAWSCFSRAWILPSCCALMASSWFRSCRRSSCSWSSLSFLSSSSLCSMSLPQVGLLSPERQLHEATSHQKCKPECCISQPSAIGEISQNGDTRWRSGATTKHPGYWLHTRSHSHASRSISTCFCLGRVSCSNQASSAWFFINVPVAQSSSQCFSLALGRNYIASLMAKMTSISAGRSGLTPFPCGFSSYISSGCRPMPLSLPDVGS